MNNARTQIQRARGVIVKSPSRSEADASTGWIILFTAVRTRWNIPLLCAMVFFRSYGEGPVQCLNQMRRQAAQFFPVIGREALQDFAASRGQPDSGLPAVFQQALPESQ